MAIDLGDEFRDEAVAAAMVGVLVDEMEEDGAVAVEDEEDAGVGVAVDDGLGEFAVAHLAVFLGFGGVEEQEFPVAGLDDIFHGREFFLFTFSGAKVR